MSQVQKKCWQREFSGVQGGKRNYGFFANVHGLSWFWSGCALRAPSSVVRSHASQTWCLTEKRALAGTSRGLDASSAGRLATCGGRWGWHHPTAFRIWILMVTFSHSLWFFTLFMNVTAVIGQRDPEQTPRHRLGRSEKRLQNTHTDERKYKAEWERDACMEISRHDYSNTVIKEEMLFFRLSGWLMRDRISTQMLLFSLTSRPDLCH